MYTIRKGREISCFVCEKLKYFNPSRIKEGKKYYCGSKCQGKDRLGKENPHNLNKGHTVTFSCENCGKEKKQKLAVYKKCKHHFCSRKCANKFNAQFHIGKNHHAWKGGITEENHKIRASAKYSDWRLKVFQRDRFTCINCNYRSKGHGINDIIADHIKPFSLYPKLRLVVSNGRTLCKRCDGILGWNWNRKVYSSNSKLTCYT